MSRASNHQSAAMITSVCTSPSSPHNAFLIALHPPTFALKIYAVMTRCGQIASTNQPMGCHPAAGMQEKAASMCYLAARNAPADGRPRSGDTGLAGIPGTAAAGQAPACRTALWAPLLGAGHHRGCTLLPAAAARPRRQHRGRPGVGTGARRVQALQGSHLGSRQPPGGRRRAGPKIRGSHQQLLGGRRMAGPKTRGSRQQLLGGRHMAVLRRPRHSQQWPWGRRKAVLRPLGGQPVAAR